MDYLVDDKLDIVMDAKAVFLELSTEARGRAFN